MDEETRALLETLAVEWESREHGAWFAADLRRVMGLPDPACVACGHVSEGVEPRAVNRLRRALGLDPLPPECPTRLVDVGDVQGPGRCGCVDEAHG